MSPIYSSNSYQVFTTTIAVGAAYDGKGMDFLPQLCRARDSMQRLSLIHI